MYFLTWEYRIFRNFEQQIRYCKKIYLLYSGILLVLILLDFLRFLRFLIIDVHYSRRVISGN